MPSNERGSVAEDHFVISRVFDAPVELVWRAWTQPERIAAWLGPKTTGEAWVIRHELRVGGVFLSAMRLPDGSEMCVKFVYREVTPMSRLAWVHSFADINGNPVRHPMSPTWPMELLTTVDFADLGGRTEVTLDWLPLDADAVERKTFSDGKPGMRGGWMGSFDQLAAHLARG